jgi:hypothetical protein
MLLTAFELAICVLLSFFGVAYVGAVDVFGLRCIMDSVRFKVRFARGVAKGVPSRLSILFLVCSCWCVVNCNSCMCFLGTSVYVCFVYIFAALVGTYFLVVLWCYS